MAVRIALQCSEADAHLILSENNPAAKLLSRPGEAIYNDANGAPEGNHFFQVVWLSDERREAYLRADPRPGAASASRSSPARRSSSRGTPRPTWRATPCSPRGSRPPTWPESPRSAQAWLGDAGRDQGPDLGPVPPPGGEPPPDRRPERRGGARRHGRGARRAWPPSSRRPASDTVRSGARFFVLDGTPEDHPQAGLLARVAGVLPARRRGRRLARRGADPRRGGRRGRAPPAARRRRRPRALPLHPRPAAVPRPPPPRGRLQLLPHATRRPAPPTTST